MSKKKPLQAEVRLRLQMTPQMADAAAAFGMTEKKYFAHYIRLVRLGFMKPVDGSLIRKGKS